MSDNPYDYFSYFLNGVDIARKARADKEEREMNALRKSMYQQDIESQRTRDIMQTAQFSGGNLYDPSELRTLADHADEAGSFNLVEKNKGGSRGFKYEPLGMSPALKSGGSSVQDDVNDMVHDDLPMRRLSNAAAYIKTTADNKQDSLDRLGYATAIQNMKNGYADKQNDARAENAKAQYKYKMDAALKAEESRIDRRTDVSDEEKEALKVKARKRYNTSTPDDSDPAGLGQ